MFQTTGNLEHQRTSPALKMSVQIPRIVGEMGAVAAGEYSGYPEEVADAAPDSSDEVDGVASSPSTSEAPFRSRDSAGALRPSHADIDSAYARGYTQGLDEGGAASRDRWKTILCSLLEAKFGELDNHALDWIERANQATVERWMVAAISAQSLEALFRSDEENSP